MWEAINDISIYNRGVRYVYDLLSGPHPFYRVSTPYGHPRTVGIIMWYGGGTPAKRRYVVDIAVKIICNSVTRTVKIL